MKWNNHEFQYISWDQGPVFRPPGGFSPLNVSRGNPDRFLAKSRKIEDDNLTLGDFIINSWKGVS